MVWKGRDEVRRKKREQRKIKKEESGNRKGGKRESERRGKDRGSGKSKEGRRWYENQRLKSSEDTTARDRGREKRKSEEGNEREIQVFFRGKEKEDRGKGRKKKGREHGR
jgi:hypothetical protein